MSFSLLPKISVIVPSLNQGNFLADTLESILGQEYPRLEVLVLDGGSTDTTLNIIHQYKDKLAYWRSRPDEGQALAINEGMARATGDVLCWLNSDDLFLPGTLRTVGEYFKNRTNEARLLYGDVIVFDQRSRLHRAVSSCANGFDPAAIRHRAFIIQPSSFWTRRLWNTTGSLANYHYIFDWEWFIRAMPKATLEYRPQFFAVYRLHPNHKSSYGGQRRRQEILALTQQYAPARWAQLYRLAFNHYERLRVANRVLSKIPLVGIRCLLPLIIPATWRYLRHYDDLVVVVDTYG